MKRRKREKTRRLLQPLRCGAELIRDYAFVILLMLLFLGWIIWEFDLLPEESPMWFGAYLAFLLLALFLVINEVSGFVNNEGSFWSLVKTLVLAAGLLGTVLADYFDVDLWKTIAG